MAGSDYATSNGLQGTSLSVNRKGLRFGNFESIQALPNVGGTLLSNEKSLRKAQNHFTNRQTFHKICRWFETWMPWQKRIMLCGTTDRCSNNQLEYLTTALEPVFHRDFAATLHQGGPPGTLLENRRKKDPQTTPLRKALSFANEGTASEGEYRHLGGADYRRSPGHGDLEEFAKVYVREVIRSSLDIISGQGGSIKAATSTDQTDDFQKRTLLDQEDTNNNIILPSNKVENTVIEGADHYLHSEHSKEETRGITPAILQTDGTEPKNARVSPATLNSDDPQPKTAGVKGQNVMAARSNQCTLPGCKLPYTPLFAEHLGGHIVTDSGTNFTPGYGTGSYMYAPLQTNKVSTLTWCMKHCRRGSSTDSPLPAASAGNEPVPHQHTQHLHSYTASTKDFFESNQRGKMYRAMRTGQIKKPQKMTDVGIPLQKTFKNAKWWGKEPSSGRQLVPAQRSHLKEHFMRQVKQIWEWMQEWEDYEKGDLLVELIKLCDQDLVRFVAQCLHQRLRDRNDINSLPDKLLLHIFSFLPSGDVIMAERVCRRWHYIAAQEDLWRLKCQEMGNKEGFMDLPALIEDMSQSFSVDWRSAYIELCQVAQQAKTPILPTTQVGKTGTKKWFSINFTELLKKKTQTPESIKITPIESLSFSSEGSSFEDFDRKHSTVVDVPIQCMQAEVEAGGSEEDSIKELTMSEFAIQGLAQDFNLFPELSKPTDLPAFLTTVQPSQNVRSVSGATFAKGDIKEDGDVVEAPSSAIKKKKKKKNKNKNSRADEDVALDVRPELMQAKDILSDLQGDFGPPMKSLKHPGWVKPVKRVRRLQGHTDAIFCLMFDKCRIVTGSMDRTIRVWDIRSGRSIRKIYGHKGGIRCLQFDETRIVSGSWDMTVMIWDIVRFNHIATLIGHLDVVSCLKFDRNHLVTGSHDNTIRVWSMTDYRCLRILTHHRDSVTCLVFTGRFVTSGSADRTIQMSNIMTGECVLKLSDYMDAVTALDVMGGLIVGGTLSGKLFFWDKFSGKAVAGVQPHDTTIYKIVFLPRGRGGARFITAAGDGSIKEWDLYNMTCLRALHGHKGPVRDVKVSGDRIISCSEDGNVRIWDLLTPPLRLGDKGEDDTIETRTIDQRKDR